jgi:uncharacterized membrane protein
MENFCDKIITKMFVDNIYLHKFIGCHRLSDRSFFICNRQFHICARCTGLLVGMFLSLILLLLPARNYIALLFPVFLGILLLDGLTQHFHLRKSNNLLRFFTGITTTSTFLPFLLLALTKIYERI